MRATSPLRHALALPLVTMIGLAAARAQAPVQTPVQAPEPTRLRGTITAVAGPVLTIQPAAGAPLTLRLAPDAKVTVTERASLADIKPGSYVGIANVGGDGHQDALEVHIFPEAARGSGEGQRGWDLGHGNGGASRMTNGSVGTKVEAVDGQTLTVTYKGGQSAIQVRPNTPVVRFVPGTAADLKVGNGVFVRDARPGPDGSLTTAGVTVGRGGVNPPM